MTPGGDDGSSPPPRRGYARAQRIVDRVRTQIRARPGRLITLEDAARDAGLSPARLHAVFSEIQGETFGAFVRRARLEYACGLMRAWPNRSLTAIAHEAGFSESSDFTRSFRRTYGVAPSRWNRVRPLSRIASAPPPENEKNRQASGGDPARIADIGYPDDPGERAMPVQIRTLPARRMAALHVPDANIADRQHAAFDRLERWLNDRDQCRTERYFMGLSFDSDLDTPPDLYRFELVHEVDAGVAAEADILIRTVPAMTAAMLACRGGAPDFIAAWDHLQRCFLPRGPWRRGKGPELEIYYADPRRSAMQYWDMDCVIPVEKDTDND